MIRRMGDSPQVPVVGGDIKHLRMVQDDEPVFVVRASDALAIFVLNHYQQLLHQWVPEYTDMDEGLTEKMKEFKAWQRAHPDRIKFPD